MKIKILNKKQLLWWVATIGLMIGIFLFSNQPATESSSISGGIVEKIVKPVLELLRIQYSETVHTIFRKIAHFTFYGLLGISVFNLLRSYQIQKSVLLSLLICFLYASTDEFHQTFVPGRSGEFRDVIIDISGSIFGTIVILIVSKVIRKKNVNETRSDVSPRI
ncbi:MAG: acetobutylicum phosphotransbutyrylase [Bacillales bacterium]|jgi:VanZ family protein|nr:acetobutylicum phosphotransbutyrylase [Bacillales bacterium]